MSKKSNCALVGLIALGTALSAMAYDTTGYVTLTGKLGDTINKTWSFNSADEDPSPTYMWDDGLAPTAGKKYLVGDAKQVLYTKNDGAKTYTFAGDVLALAGTFWPRDQKSVIPHLHLLNGGVIKYATTSRSLINTAIENFAAKESPSAVLTDVTWAGKINFSSVSFSGASDTAMNFNGNLGSSSVTVSFVFDSKCDASQYLGLWSVVNTGTGASLLDMNLSDISLGGTMEIGEKTQLSASGTTGPSFGALVVKSGATVRLDKGVGYSVGDLTLEDGAIIDIVTAFDGAKGLNVSGKLDVKGRVRIKAAKSFATGTPKLSQVIRLGETATGTLDPSQFSVEIDPFTTDASLAVDATGRALELAFVEVVTKETNDANAAGSCFLEENKSLWSNGEFPDDNHIYFAKKTVSMPTSSASEFPGRTLVLSSSFEGTGAQGTCTIRDFRMFADASVTYYYNKGVWLCGKLTTTNRKSDGAAGSAIPIFSRNDSLFGIASEISGDADFRFKVGYNDVNYLKTPKAKYALTGLNTNFTGKMLFTCPSPVYLNEADAKAKVNPVGPNATYCAKIWAWDERNFGGPLASFRYDAFELQNWSVLNVTNDFVFSEPTRGMKLTAYGRFNVSAGCTLTITNKQVTYSGVLSKEGPGTLILGGTAKFLDGTYDTPYADEVFLEGTNVLSVQAGALGVVDAAATRNLSVQLASGVSLVVRPGATAEHALDVTGDGADLTGLDGAAVGPIPVAFDITGATPGPCATVICTAKSDDLVFTLPNRISDDADWRGYRLKLEKTTIGDVTTYVATAFRTGLMLIVR